MTGFPCAAAVLRRKESMPGNLLRARPAECISGFAVIGTILNRQLCQTKPDRQIAFTFDDGPDPAVTPALLDVLHSHRVRAYFCPIGVFCEKYPDLLRRIVDDGHLVVNHTWRHRLLQRVRMETLINEIEQADAIFGRILGVPDYRSTAFRPPFGFTDARLLRFLRERSMRICGLTRFHFDPFIPATGARVLERIVCRDLERDRGGAVVFHETVHGSRTWNYRGYFDRTWLPAAVGRLIDHFSRQGYGFQPDWLVAPPVRIPTRFEM